MRYEKRIRQEDLKELIALLKIDSKLDQCNEDVNQKNLVNVTSVDEANELLTSNLFVRMNESHLYKLEVI